MAKTNKTTSKRSVGRPKNEPGCRWNSEAMRIVRLLRGETQTSLAHRVGVSPATISRWEGGSCSPPQAVVSLMAHALEVPATAFGSKAAASRAAGGGR